MFVKRMEMWRQMQMCMCRFMSFACCHGFR